MANGGGGSKYRDDTYNQSDRDQSRLDFSYCSPAIRQLLVNGQCVAWRHSAVALNWARPMFICLFVCLYGVFFSKTARAGKCFGFNLSAPELFF